MSSRTVESSAEAIILAFLLVSSGLAASASVGTQPNDFTHNGALTLSPQKVTAQQSGNGFFFFASVGDEKGAVDAYSSSLSDPQAQPPQGLPAAPSSQLPGGVDYVFVREGDTYIIFPQSVTENNVAAPLMQLTQIPQVWLDLAKRRSKFRIYVDILDALKRGAMTSFEISFCLRLNTKRTKKYLKFLAEKELLESSTQDDKNVYRLTSKGLAFAENVRMALLLEP